MKLRIFRPGKKGAATVVGPLEGEVLEAIWALGGEVTARDVHDVFEQRRAGLAYSTIKAVMTNLSGKGYLGKKSAGRSNVFWAKVDKQRFNAIVVGDVVRSLYRHYRNPLLAHIADAVSSDDESLERLERLIEERRGKKAR